MDLDINEASLPVFQALSSAVRLELIQIISTETISATQLAKRMNVSKAAISKNLHILEETDLIRLEKGADGRELVPRMNVEKINVNFPEKIFPQYHSKVYSLPVGSYFEIEGVEPSCGLATSNEIVGAMDDVNVFFSAERFRAELLWFTQGEIEYIIPNEIPRDGKAELVEFDLELSSEFPLSNNNWQSKVGFWINDIFIGAIELPGNYSDVRGTYTPEWWPDDFSQYGLLKHIRVGKLDTAVDSISISDVNVADLHLEKQRRLALKMAVLPVDGETYGGVTIFGREFGNHHQDIKATIYYSQKD
ncbi:ArsR family transcriptional regulator [Ligilactobacillus salitolerans]|uniref:ArsR family transcriptional regulator n=1 Tax=Ligilactobacillus salitolerans TaxID=1808352 RepID=A0A401IQQ4_9LACO|nr:helix-turn-helix domain-containing protein [Ligilactobacillus salitolerans]GBG93867.1 ArsR family transcriptional regulator [Ligilactobacillus salitolerans]